MTLAEPDPVRDDVEVTGLDNVDKDTATMLDDDRDTALPSGTATTRVEKWREQKAAFDSWLQTDAAQQPVERRRQHGPEEVEDELLSIKALMARQESAQIVKNPREYQLELFEKAKTRNTIAVLDTGSGKTLIAVLLIRWIIDQELELRTAGKPPKISFFLVASVTLVFQQHAVLEANLDHKVARFCGAMKVDTWAKAVWDQHFAENKVIVCTADILLQCLSHSYTTMEQINLLVFDEAHHTKKNHAYARIIKDYYLADRKDKPRPRIFGMTASPVDSKSDVAEAALELESLLDSRIATASDMSFHDAIKKQEEQVHMYNQLGRPFETEFLRETKERFAHVKVLHNAFNKAKDIAAELGPWCADQYLVNALAEEKLRKYESKVEKNFHRYSAGRPMSDLDNEIAEVRKVSEDVLGRWLLRPYAAEDSSDKVRVLHDFLSREFERPSEYRCLVFVNERHTASLLAATFKRMGIEHLRPGFLTGAGSGNIKDAILTFRQQVVTMTQFRKGEINCLFATSVAEEGLDVPDCNVVVRFSLYTTMVQYVQSRGRARQTNSKSLHMLERGNSIQLQAYHDVRSREAEMKNLCQRLPEDSRLVGNQDALDTILAKEKTPPPYIVPSTGAKLTYGNALAYLANFVSAVPTNAEEPQHPTYVVTSRGARFEAEVNLPVGAPIRFATGEVHSQKSLAKRSAAFFACRELRKKGFLDDHLLPTYVKKLPAMRNALLAVSSKQNLVYDMKTKPAIWEQTWGAVPNVMFVTIVDFSDGLGRDHQPIAMLTRTPMPHFPQFPVFLNDGESSEILSYPIVQSLQLTDNSLSMITAFTMRVFKDVFSKRYEVQPERLSYWLAPVKGRHSKDDVPSSVLDWDLMQKVSEREDYVWSVEMRDEELANRFITDKFDGGRKFFTKGVSQDLKPLDPVPKGTAKHKWMGTILNYSNSMFKSTREKFKDTWDLSQPVVEAEKVLPRRNMLTAPVPKELKDPSQVFICLQPLQISVLPPRVAVSFFVWPAIIWRFESYLIALEAAEMVGIKCEPAMALAAITKDSDNSGEHETQERINFQHGMGENYERLEFMGDCFLKTATTLSTFIQNPNDNEFEFHVKRMVMLCNRNLFGVATELKLYEYIRSRAFARRLWYPEGLKLLEGKGAKKTEETEEEQRLGSKHNLGEKTIADVCEAMIGAAFMSHNKLGDWHPDQWENAIQTVTKLVNSEDHKMLKWQDYRDTYAIPSYQTEPSTASQRDMAQKVEQEHDYHFRHPRLLRSAFIHPSQPWHYEKVPDYQRLEFLGDALLDQASITYLFYKFPDKDPQWLTEHKMAMIGNRALGMIAATTGFYKHIRHSHATVEAQIRQYVEELKLADAIPGRSADYWTAVSDPPKCLADIVEAYVGAVFIDSNFDYNEVQRFFDRHIQPHFEDMSLYDGYANNHPCTHLHRLLDQTYGCQHYRIITRPMALGQSLEENGVVLAVMIHNEVLAHDRGKSERYARVRVAKLALERLEGLAPYEFRARFKCDCSSSKGDN